MTLLKTRSYSSLISSTAVARAFFAFLSFVAFVSFAPLPAGFASAFSANSGDVAFRKSSTFVWMVLAIWLPDFRLAQSWRSSMFSSSLAQSFGQPATCSSTTWSTS